MLCLIFFPLIGLLSQAVASAIPRAQQIPRGGYSGVNYTAYVDPLIGTEGAIPHYSVGSGNSFPGAAVPFGMVKLGPDMSALNISSPAIASANSGYLPIGNITGFSMMHTSGTGGQPKYGVVSQMPVLGNLSAINVADNTTYWQNRTDDIAYPGYYGTHLLSEVFVELTATRHAGILRYTFPANSSPNVIVDLTHAIPSAGSGGISQKYIEGKMEVSEDGAGYSGYGVYAAGWNQGEPWKIYFCANFSEPPSATKAFYYPYTPFLVPAAPTLQSYLSYTAQYGLGLGQVFSWNASSPRVIESRVGISFHNESMACSYISSELPDSQTFDETVSAAQEEWNAGILSKIVVNEKEGERNETLWRMLYSGLYMTALMPTDRTGENPHWEGGVYYDDWYTIWDIFRSLVQLYHLMFTDRYVGMIQSLVSIWKNEGFLPDGRSSNQNGRTQGGSNADCLLADAYARGLSGDSRIDWEEAYQAMVTDAEVVPVHNVDFNAADGGTKEGRNALPDWLSKGFITTRFTRSISKTVEYSQNDFGLYVVAKGLGKMSDASNYLNRSSNWLNLWSANTSYTLPGITGSFDGFLAPRNPDGSWTAQSTFNVTNCGECEWNALTYEALIWEMSFNIPHDVASLIERMGGDAEFERRLDASFLPGYASNVGVGNTAGTMLVNPGNEPDFLTPYLYSYMNGKMWKTVNQTRSLIDQFYSDKVNGIPGNGDAGAMQGNLIWNLLGLYPVSTQPILLLSAPFFKSVDVKLGTVDGGVLKIRAPNLNATNIYPQSITVNGKQINTSWIWSDEVYYGGEIVFDMGAEPAYWDTGALPPSLSTGGFGL